jgi:hypothetical protein
MKHDGNLDANSNDLIFQHISKILSQFLWVNDLHIPMSGFSNLSDHLHFASFAFYRHDIYWKVTIFGYLGEFFIYFFVLLG